MEQLAGIILIAGLAGLLLLAAKRFISSFQHRKQQANWVAQGVREGMPLELIDMTVVGAEIPLRTGRKAPARIHGKADLLLQNRNGQIVVMDTKTRNRPRTYFSDAVQISLYAYCLRHGNRPVATADKGWIRIVERKTGKVTYKKIRLLDDATIEALYRRYLAVKSGREKPVCTCRGRLCGGRGAHAA